MCDRDRPVRGGDPADGTFGLFQRMGSFGYLFGAGACHLEVAGNPFVEQQLGGPHRGLGVEQVSDEAVEDDIGDGDQGHRLMVSHERPHQNWLPILWQT